MQRNPIQNGDARMMRAIAPQVAAHPGTSGLHLLSDGRDAFAARAADEELRQIGDMKLDDG